MHAFAGTWHLFRLALRRDRFKLPLILIVLAFTFASSAQASVDFYGKNELDQVKYAAASAPSLVGRMFNGPIGGPEIGAIVINETYLSTVIALIFISTMTVVRHTRQNEEFGRSELIESGVVSRHASLAAAIMLAVLLNIAFGLFVYIALSSIGLTASGALGTAAGMAATGITFAAIAAVAAQLADSARGANSFSAIAICVAFLLRAVGDGMGSLTRNGLAVDSALPSWFSPMAWGQLVFPFSEKSWWVFGLFIGMFAAAMTLAVAFAAKRDIGMGMIATRSGRAHALKSLLSPFGLARRLQRGTLRGWAVAVTVLGTSFGLVIKDFESLMADNEEFREAIGSQFGSEASVRYIFLSFIISMLSILIAGYAIQSLLRLRSEEANGQAESILSTSVSRNQWQLSHVSYVALGVLILTSLSALGMGLSYAISTGGSFSEIRVILEAAFTNSVAVFAIVGLTAAIIALMPRMAVAVSWAAFAGCLLILQLGALLNLPQWVINLSPFGHLPAMPIESFEVRPVLLLGFSAVILLAVSLVYFNRRDVVTA